MTQSTISASFFRFSAPTSLSPYDILKTAAILLMLCDHIGAYLYPMDEYWRVIGRLCVPIWLFLIGYAHSRRVDLVLFSAAAYLTALHYTIQSEFYGLNILWTIIALRLTLNPLMAWIGRSDTRLYAITFLLFPFAIFSRSLVEYGTMAWIIGIWGYLVRNGFTDSNGKNRTDIPLLYGLLCLTLYTITESLVFVFSPLQITVLGLGMIPVYVGLVYYLPRNIQTGQSLPRFIRSAVAILSRHTLAFYVLHLTLFLMIIAVFCRCHGGCLCTPFGIDPSTILL